MRFTQIPSDCSPLDGGAVYAFEADEAADRDFRIVDAATGRTLGAKRFCAASAGRFDIAPYLRDRFRFEPCIGPTGFVSAAGRSVAVTVETEGAAAPLRTFLAGSLPAAVPALRTTLPAVRLLGAGECDEITLLTDGPCTAALAVRRGDAVSELTFRDEGAGLRLFRLDAADFPGADALTLDFGEPGRIEYRVVERPAEAHRLAWIGSAGSVERYTFPVERSCELRAERSRVCSADGCRTVQRRGEVLLTLQSACEVPDVTRALGELLLSPEVWLIRRDGTGEPVDPVTERAVLRRHGTLCSLEIAIRSTRKTLLR